MTFSIVGRCGASGMLGVAVTTSSIAVGSRCAWARAGVGAVATQNVTLPSIGRMVLDAIEQGATAQVALDRVMEGLPDTEYRQVAVVDATSKAAFFSGARTLGVNAAHVGSGCVAAGNLLKSSALPKAMTDAFVHDADAHLAERLVNALMVGLHDAGGEEGPVHSAALLVVDRQEWPLVDLRVDWHDGDPVQALKCLWQDYAPQMQDYVTRALNPAAAPAYGVPGDE